MVEAVNIIKGDNTAYFDVDETLVLWTADEYKVNQPMVDQLKQHAARGHTVIVWSAGGWEWALRIVRKLNLDPYVNAVMCKPKWYWDDKLAAEFMPKTMRYYVK